jgi:hypothetical protein
MAESGPITAAESQRLEAVPLPLRERQHLRLLAHALRSLQDAAGRGEGPLPERARLEVWAAAQPNLADDTRFRTLLVDQLIGAGVQIQDLADGLGVSPLAMTVDQLIDVATAAVARGPGSMGPPEP